MPPPPPVTPSAHRFVAPPQATSRLSVASPHPRADAPAQQDAVTPSQQFKPTPRFSIAPARPSFPPTPRPTHPSGLSHATRTEDIADGVETPSASRRPRHRLTKVESIHDDSQDALEEQDEEMLYDVITEDDAFLVEDPDEYPTRAQEEQSAQFSDVPLGDSGSTEDQPLKRRRLTPGSGLTPEPSTSTRTMDPVKMGAGAPVLRSPPQSSKVPRFRVPGNNAAVPTTVPTEFAPSQPVGSRHRNPFLLHPTTPGAPGVAFDAAITPLPEHFSPHRRSQKFLPGGMADVVRTWVLNVGQSGSLAETASSQSRRRPNQPSKLHVAECVGEGPGDRLKLVSDQTDTHSLAQGEESSGTRAILVGPAKRNSRSPNIGDDVTVLPPSWEIEVGQHGEKWLVAVDWRVT
ncbi:uncharacterized protein BKCO1_2200072 [Diplodia corticola]|uniref:Uncharacterized protein n=1 Tax=Diplodia corticola TaxID=236234 RepID=A0A1J9S3E7_9PEZI|nr:uncharacterized protein BKCO1_2200072 [Diplodia corticola]OJD34524.1 hypothetical protein BKCO1_2200072 [Diplodia corticola]